MIPYFTKEQVSIALPYAKLIPALRLAFTQEVIAPKRHAHNLSEADNSSLLLMPVWQPQGQLGVKLVTVAPKNTDMPTVQAVFVLFSTKTGAPLALMDGEELTLRRTAAASALASSYASRHDARHLLLVGNGSLAPHIAIAHCQTRAITDISIWGRSVEKSAGAAKIIREHTEFPAHIRVHVREDLAAACHEADIICCATTSKTPVVLSDYVKAGTHLDLVGGFKPDMREVDDELMSRATVFVDTYAGALAEAGDITQTLANGSLAKSAIVAELAELCADKHLGRKSNAEITLFKSVGTAIEDLCAANLVWSRQY
ncbi:ornithine cyclodeaminase family protein [Undibacterium sp. TC4M20W]|uniref:ornithine cyclodeaminase family protein n=1 Tax=unclassified Undibacterium TaxID=2630295 RepID=UPI003BF308AA